MNKRQLARLAASTKDVFIQAMARDLSSFLVPFSPIVYWKWNNKWKAKIPEIVEGSDIDHEWKDNELTALAEHGVEMVAIWFPSIDYSKLSGDVICNDDGTYSIRGNDAHFNRLELLQAIYEDDAAFEVYLNDLEEHWPSLEE